MHDLAVRSGVEEIQSFAEIFGLQKEWGRLPSDYPDNSSTHIRKDRSREGSGYSHCRKEAGGKDYECDAIFYSRLSESCIRRIYRSVVWQSGRCSCHECSIIGFCGGNGNKQTNFRYQGVRGETDDFVYWSFVRGSFGAVVGRKKVSSEVRRAAVVMILVSALAILAQISEEMESGGIELELVRPSYGEGDYEEEMTVDARRYLDGYSYQVGGSGTYFVETGGNKNYLRLHSRKLMMNL